MEIQFNFTESALCANRSALTKISSLKMRSGKNRKLHRKTGCICRGNLRTEGQAPFHRCPDMAYIPIVPHSTVGTSNYCLPCLNAGKIELESTKKCDENRICVRKLGFLCDQQTTRWKAERTSQDQDRPTNKSSKISA